MRMLMLAGALLLIAAPAFACGYHDQTASSQTSGEVASGGAAPTTPAPTSSQPNG